MKPLCLHMRPLWLIPAVFAALLFGGSVAAFCQSSPSGTAPGQAGNPAALEDPTRPEVQPPLNVDRDPVPTLDIEVPAPAEPGNTVSSASAPGHANAIEKGRNGAYVLHTNVDEVLLNCTVIDSRGQTVTDLNMSDFRVWEDGVPQTLTGFLHQDEPVSMGILVDNSGSMRDKRSAVNMAALDLLRESNRQDAAFIVNFAERAYLDQGFTSDLVALNRGLSRFDSKGTTALYDAVVASADELSKHGPHRKQVLLIITDGADNASHLTLAEAIRRVQNLGGPVVYTIGLLYDDDKQESRQARNALEMLSEETGGIAYFPNSLQDVEAIASDVARDIREQYTVAYNSTRPMNLGGYRVVHVEAIAPKHGKLIVRTKRGYYANANPGQPPQTAEEQKP